MESAHTTSRSYPTAARAPVLWSAKSGLDRVRVLAKKHHQLLQETIFFAVQQQSGRPGTGYNSFGCGDGSCVDWRQRRVVHISFLFSGCLVYGALVAAIVGMLSVFVGVRVIFFWVVRFSFSRLSTILS